MAGRSLLPLNYIDYSIPWFKVDYPFGMQDESCKALYDYWISLSQNGLPHPANIAEHIIEPFKQDLCWVRVREKRHRKLYQFEKVGSALEYRLGRILTGTTINEDTIDDGLADCFGAYRRVCRLRGPDLLI